MKTATQRVEQILRISNRILAVSDKHRAAKYFAMWLRVVNHKWPFEERKN